VTVFADNPELELDYFVAGRGLWNSFFTFSSPPPPKKKLRNRFGFDKKKPVI